MRLRRFPDRPPRSVFRNVRACGLFAALWLGSVPALPAQDLEATWKLFHGGDYEKALAAARTGREENPRNDTWWRIEAECLMTLGRYEEAHTALEAGLQSTVRDSIRLRLIALEAARFAGKSTEADRYLQELRYTVVSRRVYAPSTEFVVALGEAALLLGAEPRLVLENFLRRGREADPPVRDAFLAIGRLALEKHDDALASRTFQQGLEKFPGDPDLWTGLAAAFMSGDRTKLVEYATHALELNDQHAGARLLLAEHLIDSEQYDDARAELEKVLAVNATHPEALALRAVIAELRNDEAGAAADRATALSSWDKNPRVDHLIGRKLSQKYRFREGAAAQRRALAFDRGFTPARIQLAQDLLRLGRDSEGWALAAEVHKADAYDVSAFNLVNLHDRIDSFTTLTNPHFRLRMSATEAPIYGARALALLERAYQSLTAKYGVTLDEVTTVEIYPNPKDFAVRTFGMPDNPGFLGVCFGPVVTVNSPATKRANWEAVLWHEFTHTVTLTFTRNRMPRWLSEGISVFEELEQNPAWGQLMSLDYHDRITNGRMQPISDMSAAFLKAESGADLQFAYYQSYLVVRFIVETHGFDRLRAVLAALREGREMNTALAQNIAPLDELDATFAKFARALADQLGGDLDLTKPSNAIGAALARVSDKSFLTRFAKVKEAMNAGNWSEAKTLLTELTAGGLYLPGAENLHTLLARACAELGDTAGERAALTTVAEHEGDALDVATRLLELARADEDWAGVARWADHALAINPLAPTPWRALLTAGEQRDDAASATNAGTILLKLDPPDRARVHYRVARQLESTDVAAARRHVLLALEEAPRFRDAHALLVQLPPSPDVAAAMPGTETETHSRPLREKPAPPQ